MAGEPNLSPGDTGEWVSYLQQMLAHNGYPVEADGNYGNATSQALDQFQQAHGINTGSVDSTTWGLLTGETAPAGSADSGAAPAGGAEPNQAEGQNTDGTIHFDPANFPTLFGMYGVQGEQYVASLGLQAPSEGDDTALA
jgi:peptidoglycan hydrolase-like protein with peptidoglycan-binding domain